MIKSLLASWRHGRRLLQSEEGVRTFLRVWAGQVVSVLGSGLTGFATGVWVYEQTESVTSFALTIFAATLPSLLIMPFQGPLVDRMDRRKMMILADSGQGLGTLVLMLLLLTGKLQVWHVWVVMGISGVFAAGHGLAWIAATTLLIPNQHLGRANGLLQLGPSVAQILSPILAGGLFALAGLQGVLVIDLITFVVALFTLFGVVFPAPEDSSQSTGGGVRGLFRDVWQGWKYITERPGLKRLLLLFTTVNLSVGLASALIIPLLMTFAAVEIVGVVTSVNGSGLVLGSVLLTVWGGPKDRVQGVIRFGLLMGVSLMLASLHPSAVLVAVAGFGWMFAAPFINGCSQALWQVKTPPRLQGRVFAVRATVARSATPLAYLMAGPLVDRVFEPLLVAGGALVPTLGRVVGVGEGRGTAALLLITGAVATLTLAAASLSPRLRNLDAEVPDALEDVVSEASKGGERENRALQTSATMKLTEPGEES